MYGLLHGLRVVEGAAFIAGPSCGLHLAQMGAEVIRFDHIGGGPDFGRWPLAPSGASLYWEGLNKGKKSIAIDLGSPAGRELAVALATAPGPEAGLFLTNYPVDGFLSYEHLRAARNDVICLRIMGWPDGSPALDYTVNAAVGIPAMTGPVNDPAPVNHVLPAWDLLAGSYAAFALLAAERERRLSRVGREVRIALSDLAAASLSHMGFVAEVSNTGRDRERLGNDLYGAFGRDFITRDGRRVMVCAITPRQWSSIVSTLGLKDAVAALEHELGVSFAKDEGQRFVHRARLYPLFEAAFATRVTADLALAFDAAGVTWAPYQSLHEAVTSDARLYAQNPMFEQILNPSGLTYLASGPAASMPGTTRQPLVRAPRLGEHTDEVLAAVLGLSAAAIGRLHDQRLVASAEHAP
jgi:2-methylfumaryl-CoA isomerase